MTKLLVFWQQLELFAELESAVWDSTTDEAVLYLCKSNMQSLVEYC